MKMKIIGALNTEYLRELRVRNGITPIQIAEKLGVGLSTYYKWEGGKQTPSILKIQLLQLMYKKIDYNKLLAIDLKKCYNSNCIDRERGNNE